MCSRATDRNKSRKPTMLPANPTCKYLHGGEGKLFYHGQFDDARPKNGVTPTGADLREAVDLLLAGKSSPQVWKPAIGCNIKWRDDDDQGYEKEQTTSSSLTTCFTQQSLSLLASFVVLKT